MSSARIRSFPLKSRIIAWVFRQVMKLLAMTCRIVEYSGEEHFQKSFDGDEPVILTYWHNRLIYFAPFLEKRWMSKGKKTTVMVSQSKDGDFASMMAFMSGCDVVYGSPSKGGAEGLRAMCNAMSRDKSSMIILPDGSKGPRYELKAGTIALARITGCRILPMSFSANRFWRVKSWDRLMVPKPFARISVHIGEPILVEKRVSGDELEAVRKDVEGKLIGLGEAAFESFGLVDE